MNIVVIPVYKSSLSETELLSFKQCLQVLSNHTITLVSPEGLDLEQYWLAAEKKLPVVYFKAEFFVGIRGYNRLMMSLEFYKQFSQYHYMLVYQLDCYVFTDQLLKWCAKGFDYIGSPWLLPFYFELNTFEKIWFRFKQYIKRISGTKKYRNKSFLTLQVGNGGFSLRKINAFINTLEATSQRKIDQFTGSNDALSIFNEDVFWSFEAPKIKKPSYKLASEFSLDLYPDVGLKINDGKLPFGCHGWPKKYQYWENYIKRED